MLYTSTAQAGKEGKCDTREEEEQKRSSPLVDGGRSIAKDGVQPTRSVDAIAGQAFAASATGVAIVGDVREKKPTRDWNKDDEDNEGLKPKFPWKRRRL